MPLQYASTYGTRQWESEKLAGSPAAAINCHSNTRFRTRAHVSVQSHHKSWVRILLVENMLVSRSACCSFVCTWSTHNPTLWRMLVWPRTILSNYFDCCSTLVMRSTCVTMTLSFRYKKKTRGCCKSPWTPKFGLTLVQPANVKGLSRYNQLSLKVVSSFQGFSRFNWGFTRFNLKNWFSVQPRKNGQGTQLTIWVWYHVKPVLNLG